MELSLIVRAYGFTRGSVLELALVHTLVDAPAAAADSHLHTLNGSYTGDAPQHLANEKRAVKRIGPCRGRVYGTVHREMAETFPRTGCGVVGGVAERQAAWQIRTGDIVAYTSVLDPV